MRWGRGAGEGGKEDIRKGMRVSSCSANTFATTSASFKVQNLCEIFVTERGPVDHLCMVTKADRSDEDWQQGQLAPSPGPVFNQKNNLSVIAPFSIILP
jgi:hypothetical protein